MHWKVLCVWFSLAWAQETLLRLADSIAIYGNASEALRLYDSLLSRQGNPDRLRLRAYLGSQRPLLAMRRFPEVHERADTAEQLALRLRDTLGYVEALSARGEVLTRQNRYAEADSILRTALVIAERRYRGQPATGILLYRIGFLKSFQNQHDEAESWYRRALDHQRRTISPGHPDYATTLSGLAFVQRSRRRYAEAESLHMRVRDIRARTLGATHPDYIATLNNLAVLYGIQGRYAQAESLHLQVKQLRATVLGTDHPDYALTLNNLGALYYGQGRYPEAEQLFQEAAEIRGRMLGPDHPEYLQALSNLAAIYHARGRYPESESLYVEVKAKQSRLLPADHSEYLSTLNNLAGVYRTQGRYTDAEKLYRDVRAAQARTIGTDHPDYTRTLANLANTYLDRGRYAEAESLLLEVRESRRRTLGVEHPVYASTLNTLAAIYQAQGRYTEAEKLYLEVRDIQMRGLGIEHPSYAITLNNLSVVYEAQGRYTEAEKLYLEARAILEHRMGTDHPDYALILSNLANVYLAQGQYDRAERLYRTVKDIQERRLGTVHPEYAQVLNNLALIHQALRQYAEAETLFRQVIAIQIQTTGTEHPEYARSLSNLANVCYLQHRFPEAEKLHMEAREIRARLLGADHPQYYHYTLFSMAQLYNEWGRYDEADALWQEVIQKNFHRIEREFIFMATAQRQNLLENVIHKNLLAFQEYVAKRRTPGLIQSGYRAARSMKGLLLTSTEGMRRLIESRPQDTLLQNLYKDWQSLTEAYVFYTLREDYRLADSLREKATNIERQIVEKLPELRAFLPDLAREPLSPPLRKGEVAIEVVRILPEGQDSVLYLFYIVEGGKKAVRLHVHPVDTLQEKKMLAAYEILRSPGAMLTGSAYRLVWSFVDSLLPKGVRVLYFSPDGIYYQVNVASLYDGRGFVIDRYDVRYVATTRRLLVERPRLPASKPAVIGNPDFMGRGDSVPEQRTRSYRAFPDGIPPLPGAEQEAKAIAHLLNTDPVIGPGATEEYLKSLHSPQILHIATHGYFMSTGKEPMLEGGILLAQAALWDSLYPPLGADDGRLTAQEASTLNLLGTDLVVLSACETGLGEVRGEGLYGLQRAFLEAGAGRVITTLWQIDDEATRMLMEDFYLRWLGEASDPTQRKKRDGGPGIDAAFMETLREFRRKYPAPYYWGAFVLMR